MTLASEIDTRGAKPAADEDLVLGEDWVSPTSEAGQATQERRRRRGGIAINRSPLARRIIFFNLLALLILGIGVFWLNPVRDNLVQQREASLINEAHLIADAFEAQLPASAPVNLVTGDGVDVISTLAGLNLSLGVQVFVFDQNGTLVAKTIGRNSMAASGSGSRNTVLTSFLNGMWDTLSGLFSGGRRQQQEPLEVEVQLRELLAGSLGGETQVQTGIHADGGTIFSVAAPIMQSDAAVGVVGVSNPSGQIT